MDMKLILPTRKAALFGLLIIALFTSACSYDATDQSSLLKKCRDKKSIVGFSITYQILEDAKALHYKEVFDDKISKVESVDICECFVSKVALLPEKDKQNMYAEISKTDRRLKEELEIFSKKGLFGKFSHEEKYQSMYGSAAGIPHLKELLTEASQDKFIRAECTTSR